MSSRVTGSFGPYEYAFAHRDPKQTFGVGLISKLAVYSDDELVEPGNTMDLPRQASPRRTRLRGLLFSDFGRLDDPLGTGVLLVVGLTHDELDRAKFGDSSEIDALLRTRDDYPYTDWRRRSLLRRPR